MKVKMNRTCFGSPDGVQVNEYRKGETVELPDALAGVFVQQRWAVRVGKASRKVKDQGAAPENKTKRNTERGRHGA